MAFGFKTYLSKIFPKEKTSCIPITSVETPNLPDEHWLLYITGTQSKRNLVCGYN